MSEAANTDETPSMVTSTLFIGVMAARSMHTLQHLGITHILRVCANDFGQTDSQHLDTFQYKNLSVITGYSFDLLNLVWLNIGFIDSDHLILSLKYFNVDK